MGCAQRRCGSVFWLYLNIHGNTFLRAVFWYTAPDTNTYCAKDFASHWDDHTDKAPPGHSVFKRFEIGRYGRNSGEVSFIARWFGQAIVTTQTHLAAVLTLDVTGQLARREIRDVMDVGISAQVAAAQIQAAKEKMPP